jgi:hypothetical protein
MSMFRIGDRVRATQTITEGGWNSPGSPDCKFPEENYIHAEAGDVGEVEYVDDEGWPTVRFDRKGTATIVSAEEIELIPAAMTLSDRIGTTVERVSTLIRTALTHHIGERVTEQQLRDTMASTLQRMEGNALIDPPERDLMRCAMEVGFGLRDPKDLLDKLETLDVEHLKDIVERFGVGPEGMFGMVLFHKQGKMRYEVTEHRPGFLAMNVLYTEPLHFIKLDITLEDEPTTPWTDEQIAKFKENGDE